MWPSLLDRMLLREMLVPLGVGLLAILQLLVLAQLLQLNEVVFGAAFTLGDLLRVTVGLAPHFLVVAVPLAFMLGVQLALGRLAFDREVLALSAAGASPLLLFRVPVAIACALGLLTAGLARFAEPWGLRELNRVLTSVIKRNLESGLQPGVFNTGLRGYVMYVSETDAVPEGQPPHFRGVILEDSVGDAERPVLALAEEGSVVDAGGESLQLLLTRGELHLREPGGETLARFGEARLLVSVQERLSRSNRFAGSEAQLDDEELESRAAALGAGGKLVEAGRLRLERFRRVAVPLACLAFALLAVPLAVASGGVRGAAYVTTLGAFVGFYALSRLGVALEGAHVSPLLAAFLPDLSVAALGAILTFRLVRRGVGRPR